MGSRVEVEAERTLVLTVKIPVFGKRAHLEKTEASIRRFLKAAFGERITVERASMVFASMGGPVSGLQIHQSPSVPPGAVAVAAEEAAWAARREMERRRA